MTNVEGHFLMLRSIALTTRLGSKPPALRDFGADDIMMSPTSGIPDSSAVPLSISSHQTAISNPIWPANPPRCRCRCQVIEEPTTRVT